VNDKSIFLSCTKPMLKTFWVISGLFSILFLSGCGRGEPSSQPQKAPALLDDLALSEGVHTPGQFNNSQGKTVGNVVFIGAPNGGVLIRVDVSQLPQGWHGIHLHQIGDCSDGDSGFKASGGHVDPDQNQHGLLNQQGAERADIPNIYAGADGRATAEIFRTGLSLYPSEATGTLGNAHPLLDDDGFAVIIHENRDDHRSQPIGGAGGRIACAVVGR